MSAWLFWPVAILFAAALAFVVTFFRDPDRRTPADARALIAPADGRIVEIVECGEPEHVGARAVKIAIFMNVFDCHVNRSPCAATVEWTRHCPGTFVNAIRSAAGLENERVLVALRDAAGRPVLLKQVAGLIARRIVCPARSGDALAAGQRFGMIRFGSRVEVFLPGGAGFAARARLGDRVTAGETVLGEWS